LCTDIHVSEEHDGFIFRAEICRFRSRSGYVGKSHTVLSWQQRGGDKKRNPARDGLKKWPKCRGLFSQVRNVTMGGERIFQ
jgi:hypothetical protein